MNFTGSRGHAYHRRMTYGTPMTDEQRFFFDLRGWILLPAVLSEAEIAPLKAQCYAGIAHGYSGPMQELLDHPAITGILTELLSEPYYENEDSYPFRCEGSFVTVRQAGWRKEDLGGTEMPHVVRPPQHANPLRYQVAGNRIFSGLTRVVWELEGGESRNRRHLVSLRLPQGELPLRRTRSVSPRHQPVRRGNRRCAR